MTDLPAPLTDEQHAAIRQRVENARPGPWHLHDDLEGNGYPGHLWVVQNPDDGPSEHHAMVNVGTKADGEFIAHARQDIPALLAEIDRLRAELATARADVMHDAASAIRFRCPYHGTAPATFMACHCTAADVIDAVAISTPTT